MQEFDLARKKIPALKDVQSQVLQQTLKRLEQAFVSMWEQNYGFPRFKKPGRMKSFVFPQLGTSPLKQGAIKLPLIGWVKFRQSREIPTAAVIKQARIVKRALRLVCNAKPPVECRCTSTPTTGGSNRN